MNIETKLNILKNVVNDYRGSIHDLERAIGVLLLGDEFGWKVLYLCHDKKHYENMKNTWGSIS